MSRPPCAACKYSRRKCTESCVFAPYFPANKSENYKAVHLVFGASHVGTLLKSIHPSQREEAMNALVFEAETHLRYPVGGCSLLTINLQRQLQDLEALLARSKNDLAFVTNNSPTFVPPPPPPVTDQQNNHNRPLMADRDCHLTSQELHGAYASMQQASKVQSGRNPINER